jgi:hypothetical protein
MKKTKTGKTDEVASDEYAFIVPSDGILEAQIDFMEIPAPYKGRYIEIDGEAVFVDDSEIVMEAIFDELVCT